MLISEADKDMQPWAEDWEAGMASAVLGCSGKVPLELRREWKGASRSELPRKNLLPGHFTHC